MKILNLGLTLAFLGIVVPVVLHFDNVCDAIRSDIRYAANSVEQLTIELELETAELEALRKLHTQISATADISNAQAKKYNRFIKEYESVQELRVFRNKLYIISSVLDSGGSISDGLAEVDLNPSDVLPEIFRHFRRANQFASLSFHLTKESLPDIIEEVGKLEGKHLIWIDDFRNVFYEKYKEDPEVIDTTLVRDVQRNFEFQRGYALELKSTVGLVERSLQTRKAILDSKLEAEQDIKQNVPFYCSVL